MMIRPSLQIGPIIAIKIVIALSHHEICNSLTVIKTIRLLTFWFLDYYLKVGLLGQLILQKSKARTSEEQTRPQWTKP